MKKVVKYNKSVSMVMLGGAYNANTSGELKEFIEKNNLSNYVKWLGHTLDMDIWYKTANIHLVTSSFECFPMSIAESKTYGIPLVTYSMPYVELLKDGKGYIEVSQME